MAIDKAPWMAKQTWSMAWGHQKKNILSWLEFECVPFFEATDSYDSEVLPSGYDWQFAMEIYHHAIKNGKPSISMGHLYHGKLWMS